MQFWKKALLTLGFGAGVFEVAAQTPSTATATFDGQSMPLTEAYQKMAAANQQNTGELNTVVTNAMSKAGHDGSFSKRDGVKFSQLFAGNSGDLKPVITPGPDGGLTVTGNNHNLTISLAALFKQENKALGVVAEKPTGNEINGIPLKSPESVAEYLGKTGSDASVSDAADADGKAAAEAIKNARTLAGDGNGFTAEDQQRVKTIASRAGVTCEILPNSDGTYDLKLGSAGKFNASARVGPQR